MNAPSQTTEFDSKEFRRALGSFATGVTIITAVGESGEMVGVTASSFNSLSLDPPLILWSSVKTTHSCTVFKSAEYFAVNVLAADQIAMSNHFARPQEDKFEAYEWSESPCGAPIFPNCAGHFECETYDMLDGGDHIIFVGRVIGFSVHSRPPLAFHRGAYSMVFSHPAINESNGEGATTGRLGEHTFYLLLMAVRAFQASYQPKQEALGFSAMEARCLIILSDLPGISIKELTSHTHVNSTIDEVQAALEYLEGLGLIRKAEEDNYALTEAGDKRAEDYWSVAFDHAEHVFKNVAPEDVATFKNVLRGIIKKS